MSGTPVEQRMHPRHRVAGRAREAWADSVQASPTMLTDGDLLETLRDTLALQAQIEASLHELVAKVDRRGLAEERASTSTAALLRRERLTASDATRTVKIALAMERHPATHAALAAAQVRADQAQVIVAAVDALPAEIGAAARDEAEAHLLDLAQIHDARALKALGKHLVDVVAPDVADQRLAAALEREEREASRRTTFSGWDDGKGSYHFSGRIPSLHGAMLETSLDALLNPDRPDPIERGPSTGRYARRPNCAARPSPSSWRDTPPGSCRRPVG